MMAKNIRMKISSMARIERPPGLSRVPSAVPDVPSARPAALQPYSPTAPQLGLAMLTPAARRGDADPRSRLGDKRVGARVQPGCGPARRSRRLRLSSVSPRCSRGSGEPHVRLERASPHTGSCSQQSPAAKRDPLQRPLPLGSRSVSVRPKAIRERQRRPRSRVCFFSLWVRMTSSTAQPGIFGAANPKKQQEPLPELRSTTQNSRKGFPKEEFLKNKGFLSF